MRLSKIYTKTGDKGETRLVDGTKVPKSHDRIEAYGTVDELNSFVGLLRDSLPNTQQFETLKNQLLKIQHELFDIGSELATPASFVDKLTSIIDNDATARLENEMDAYNRDLPPLKNFVLPGGQSSNSMAHICRTVTRRAERQVHRLHLDSPIRPALSIYLNRLSDWFFVSSRYISKQLQVAEILWDQKQ